MSERSKGRWDVVNGAEAESLLWRGEDGRWDERTAPLLEIIHELDRYSDRLPKCQVSVALNKAILACGFQDEIEAWDALMCHLDQSLDDSCLDRNVARS
jgi:hypothetical protein